MKPSARQVRLSSLLVLGTALLAACGGGGGAAGDPTPTPPPPPPPPPPSVSVERRVLPSTVDSTVDPNENQPHFVVSPGGSATGRLFVMLPGTQGAPGNYELVVRNGASRGYHAVGLDYPNAVSVGSICAADPDPACFGNVRQEIVTGENLSPRVAIAQPDAIITRLTRLLTYLQASFPNEGWGQYLNGGQVVWSRVVIAGHSQGGGHAAMIAKLQRVQRAAYFASPPDWNLFTNAPAAWFGGTWQTPTDVQYGFTHVRDGLVPFSQLQSIWQRIGLGTGTPLSVDGASAPFGNARMLSTNATPGSNGFAANPEHGAPVLDAVTPLDGAGRPVFAPVWNYMAFPN